MITTNDETTLPITADGRCPPRGPSSLFSLPSIWFSRISDCFIYLLRFSSGWPLRTLKVIAYFLSLLTLLSLCPHVKRKRAWFSFHTLWRKSLRIISANLTLANASGFSNSGLNACDRGYRIAGRICVRKSICEVKRLRDGERTEESVCMCDRGPKRARAKARVNFCTLFVVVHILLWPGTGYLYIKKCSLYTS